MSHVVDIADATIPLAERGPAPKRVVAGFGFWVFLLSDIVMFSAFFAAYAVLSHATADGPSGIELFDRHTVFVETMCLLVSSFTCGLMSIATQDRSRRAFVAWGLVSFALGAAFLGLELNEFRSMVERGAGPHRSAFLSAFFALVGLHGLHVSSGLLWLATLFGQQRSRGFSSVFSRRLLCFGLFWHALDIVWVGVITIVYLGAA